MHKIGKSKMQVNMYHAVLILLLAVCWVQSQSMNKSLSPASASNSVTTNQNYSSSTTARSEQEKSQSSPSTTATISTENKNIPNTKDHSISSIITAAAVSTIRSITTITTPKSSLKTRVTTSNSTTILTTTVATSTIPTSSTETTAAASNSTTKLTITVATSTIPTSSTETTAATSSGTTKLTTTVATTRTNTSITMTTVATSNKNTKVTTTVATSTIPTSSTEATVATSNSTTKLNTTVATTRTNTSSTKTTVPTSTGTTILTTTVAISTTPTSSTKTTVGTFNSTTNPTNTVETSRTNTSSTKITAITTGTTHKIGLSTTGTATNGNPKLTTELKTSSRTLSPDKTKTATPATSTVRVTALGKIFINEVMVGRDDVLIQVELFVTAEANIGYYTLAVFDDTQNMVQSYKLNHQKRHNGFLTVSLNNTMLGLKNNSVGIALYDANQWIKKTFNNTAGLVDALVIGTSFQTTSTRLVQVLTPGCLPIVLHQNQNSETKSITRCSEERVCDSSMFMYTSSSPGKNNSAICENRWKNIDTITLKFNCSCQTCDNTSINEIIHFLIQEIDKNCQCEVTALNIIDSYVACCGGTALHATIVAADSEQKDKMMKAYETLLHSSTTVTLGHNNYTINKECGSFCCRQTVLTTDSSKSSNIKLKVAVPVTCIMVFLIIIFVVLYRRRKKRGLHQFSMVRLNEEDEDLIMDGVENDNVVGGQGATFYKNRLGF